MGATAVAVSLALAPSAGAAACANADKVSVPGAELQQQGCLDDMTTAGTRTTNYTDASDWASLTPTGQKNPSGVPGLQVDGYFPDTSTTNTTHGWSHDAQFVIRLPDEWNGKLVITGAPGVRKQYAPDPVISDWVLAKGYAYASTDKGNSGNTFYSDGKEPGDAVVEWHMRVTELAIAAKAVVAQKYGRAPDRTYVTGISNGGYLTRWQLENRPELYDGGVDWEGTLMTADVPNIFTYLPAALRNYPKYRATGDKAAHDAMIDAGFSPGSEFLWEDHYGVYWDLTQRSYREEFDPEYDGPITGGFPFCQPGIPMCDADYDYSTRPVAQAAMRKVANTGNIGKPMLTLHGTIDALLPIATDSDIYRRMVEAQGKASLHRYYVIENGNHVDGRYDLFPDRIRPNHPCWLAAFGALEAWVERDVPPPDNQFVPDVRAPGFDVLSQCTLAPGLEVPDIGPLPRPSVTPVGRSKPRALRVSVKRRGSRRVRVTGRLLLARGVTQAQACGSGRVLVTLAGKRARPRLGKRCRFAATLRLHRKVARRDRLRVRWLGNRALEPLAIKPRRVR